MKKALVLSFVMVFCVFGLLAEDFSGFGLSLPLEKQSIVGITYDSEYNDILHGPYDRFMGGLGVSFFIFSGEEIGFMMDANLGTYLFMGFPALSSPSIYNLNDNSNFNVKIALNGMFGPAYKINLGNSGFVLGAGLDMSMEFFVGSLDYESYLSFGPGVSANYYVDIDKAHRVKYGVTAAYNFVSIGTNRYENSMIVIPSISYITVL